MKINNLGHGWWINEYPDGTMKIRDTKNKQEMVMPAPAVLHFRRAFAEDLIESVILSLNQKFSAPLIDSGKVTPQTNPEINNKIGMLDLPARAWNVIRNHDCEYVGDLVQLTEEQLFRTPNCGHGTIDAINAYLSAFNLRLGLTVKNWRRPTDAK